MKDPPARAGPSPYARRVPPIVVIEHLTKIYPNGTKALDDVSLDIEKGEFVVLIGLSGSGKSTLLRCINRLVEPTSGRILFDGQDVTAARGNDLRRIRRQIGMIFQQFNLVKRTSVFSNALSGRLGYRSTAATITSHASKQDVALAFENLDRVGILEKTYQRADSLSGGQQQRVGIARALMQRPQLMLADEPVASLDPATSHSVMKYLEEINRGGLGQRAGIVAEEEQGAVGDGITVICSLHFLSLARRYGTRVVALNAGRIVFDGAPAEIDERRFKEIYGEEAIEVEIGPGRDIDRAVTAADPAAVSPDIPPEH